MTPEMEEVWKRAVELTSLLTLNSDIVELVKQSVAAEREACCRAVCPYCDETEHFTAAEWDKHGWFHRARGLDNSFITCKAVAIRGGKEGGK